MTGSPAAGKTGFILSVLLLIATTLTAAIMGVTTIDPNIPSRGFCLLSPDLWQIPASWSSVIAFLSILCVAAVLIITNRTLNMLQTPALVHATVFLILSATCLPLVASISSGALAALIVMVCISILLTSVRSRRATHPMFAIGTLLSIGSMAQYGLLMMVPMFVIGAVILKVLRARELLAFAIGLIAPYWCTVGLGIIPLSAFQWPMTPRVFPIFTGELSEPHTFITLISLGITMVITLLLALSSYVSNYPVSSQTRRNVSVFAVFALGVIVLIIADFTNYETYSAILFLTTGVLSALPLNSMRNTSLTALMLIFSALYIIMFILTIIY